jgi:hypothetical protein
MSALFSDQTPRRTSSRASPAAARPGSSFLDDDLPEIAALREEADRRVGVKFDAELDVAELDDRGRPGPSWGAQSRELSRSGLAFRSRRMCYHGRILLVAVHLIDDAPVPLCGRVVHCSYDGDGMYRVELDLMRVPSRPNIAAWLEDRRVR